MCKSISVLAFFLLVCIELTFVWSLPLCTDILNETTTTEVDGATTDLFWSGNDRQVLFMVTNSENHTLWRSVDGGKTWSNEMSKLANSYNVRNATGTQMRGVQEIIPSPANSNIIYFLGYDGYYWVTTNRGENYTFYDASINGRFMINFVPHPLNPGWVLGLYFNKCCTTVYWDSECGTTLWCSTDLAVTKDYGATWTPLRRYVSPYYPYSFSWGEPKNRNFTSDTVLLLRWESGPYDQRYLSWQNLVFEYTDDLFATPPKATQQRIWAFVYISEANALLMGQFDETIGTHLLISYDNGMTYSAVKFPHDIPSNTFFENGYAFLDTSEGSVFVGVLIQLTSGYTTNLYVSDLLSSDFILSLQNLVWDVYVTGEIDFTRIEGLEGIYFANYYVNGTSYKRSVITFNKGATWQPLRSPINDISCPSCSLHLIGPTRSTAPHFETAASAPGVILAVGSVGEYVGPLSTANTYLSRDAGSTWILLRNGSHIFELGNYGAVIIMTDDDVDTKTVEWTLNQGLNWTECQFTPLNDTLLYNALEIFSDADSIDTVFILHTQRVDNLTNTTSYFMHYFNLDSQIPRQCAGESSPDTSFSDYETWNPTTISGECILGMNVTYVRRKQDTICKVPENFTIPQIINICSCTEADWVCDVCYTYDDLTKKCLMDCATYPDQPAVCPPNTSYPVTTIGYKKVAGSKCVGGVSMLPAPNQTRMCPNPPSPPPAPTPSGPTPTSLIPEAINITPLPSSSFSPGFVAVMISVAVIFFVIAAVYIFLGYRKHRRSSPNVPTSGTGGGGGGENPYVERKEEEL